MKLLVLTFFMALTVPSLSWAGCDPCVCGFGGDTPPPDCYYKRRQQVPPSPSNQAFFISEILWGTIEGQVQSPEEAKAKIYYSAQYRCSPRATGQKSSWSSFSKGSTYNRSQWVGAFFGCL